MKRIFALGLAAFWLLVAASLAHGRSYTSGSHPRYHSGHSSSIRCVGCSRDSHGRIKRSPKAKQSFRSSHPCPSTGRTSGRCPGYEIDHTRPLYKGGADSPGNMEWLSKEQHKAKTRAERKAP